MTEGLIIKIDQLIKALAPPIFYLDWSFWNTLVLVITLIVLIIYTIETHKLSIQAKDANLRPVLLRSGFLKDWNIEFIFNKNILISGKPIQFSVLKNIVTSISGYIIKNGKKYQLLFGNDISKNEENLVSYCEFWGWMKPENSIYAIFKNEGDITNESNKICIQYKDIEGNSYYTIEDENFDQKSYNGYL